MALFNAANGAIRKRTLRKCADNICDGLDNDSEMCAMSNGCAASCRGSDRRAGGPEAFTECARVPANGRPAGVNVSAGSPACASLAGRSPSHTEAVLLELSFRHLLPCIIGAPLLATFVSFAIGLSLDYHQILNYEWTCGRVHLPSFSRIINLPKERIFWNFFALIHVGLRPLLLWVNYRICSVPMGKLRHPLGHSLLTKAALLCGTTEVLLLAALTVVGERENSDLHVLFFSSFTVFSLLYFLLTSFLFRISMNYDTNENGPLSYKLKLGLSLLYLVLIPTIYIFFTLYWQFCYNFAYDFFASFEYATILVNYGFHTTAYLDCNDVYQLKIELDETPRKISK